MIVELTGVGMRIVGDIQRQKKGQPERPAESKKPLFGKVFLHFNIFTKIYQSLFLKTVYSFVGLIFFLFMSNNVYLTLQDVSVPWGDTALT